MQRAVSGVQTGADACMQTRTGRGYPEEARVGARWVVLVSESPGGGNSENQEILAVSQR